LGLCTQRWQRQLTCPRPHSSWSTRWNPSVFAAAGFFVITLDPAGSTGFGQKYQEGILGAWSTRAFL
jgi:dipeptidyl aminopeptidase/acylaminoacyl peptidase